MRPDPKRRLPFHRFAPLLALLAADPVLAAEPLSPDTGPWSVEVVVGASSGGPANDLVDVLKGSSWAGTASGLSSPVVTSSPAGGSRAVEWGTYWATARRRLGDGRFSVGLGGGWSGLGTVTRTQRVDGIATVLEARSRVTTVAALAWYDLFPSVRIGVGPALHVGHVGFSGSFGPPAGSSQSKVGLVLDTTAQVPVDAPFYVAATLQYRWVGSVRLPTWAVATSSGTTVVFPEASVDMSHGVAMLGLGLRF